MDQLDSAHALRQTGHEAAPHTPPAAAAPVGYASDPEGAGARRRSRKSGMPPKSSGFKKIRVGRRGRGTSTTAVPSDDDTASQAAADGGVGSIQPPPAGAAGAGAAAQDGRGAGGARRPSAGSRFGALLRRGAPTLNNLRSYRGGSGGKNAEPKLTTSSSSMMADGMMDLPIIEMSTPVELEDPPEGHYGVNGSGREQEGTNGGHAGGEDNGAAGGIFRDVSGRDKRSRTDLGTQIGPFAGDPLESRSGGPSAARSESASAELAPKSSSKALGARDVDGDLDVAVPSRSTSELSRSCGGGDDARQRRSKTSTAGAAGQQRRDRSAPPAGRTYFVTGATKHGAVSRSGGVQALGGADPASTKKERGGARDVEANAGLRRGGGGAPSAKRVASSSTRGNIFSNDPGLGDSRSGLPRPSSAASGSASAGYTSTDSTLGAVVAEEVTTLDRGNTLPADSKQRKGLDGYVSAPEVGSEVIEGCAGVFASEVDEHVARAQEALFASSTTPSGDTEIGASSGGGSGRRKTVLAGDGDEETVPSSFDSDAAAPGAAPAAVAKDTAEAFAAPVATGGRHVAVSKRRRLAELLHFRRRSSSGVGSPRNAASLSTSASAAEDSGGGKGGFQRGPAIGGHLSRRYNILRRANSTSALDGSEGSQDEDEGDDDDDEEDEEDDDDEEEEEVVFSRTLVVAVDAEKAEDFGGRKGTAGTRRRLLPGGASSTTPAAVSTTGAAAGRVASASPVRHRRHRESFLEAGKHKLRRGRSKLSRGSFGGRSSSLRRARVAAAPHGDGSPEASPRGREASSEEANGRVEVDEAGGNGALTGKGLAVEDGSEKEPPPHHHQQPHQHLPREGPAKPQLGTTYDKRPGGATGDSGGTDAEWNTWGVGSASDFNVRTKGYGRTKVKAPSAPELYELLSIDAYRSPAGRICGVYPMFTPPDCLLDGAAKREGRPPPVGMADGSDAHSRSSRQAASMTEAGGKISVGKGGKGFSAASTAGGGVAAGDNHDQASSTPTDGDGGGTGHPDIPPVLVVNCQLPDIPTPFSVQGDGPTVHVVFTFGATRRLRRYAARVWAEERGTTAAYSGGGERMGLGSESEAADGTGGGGGGGGGVAVGSSVAATLPSRAPMGDASVAGRSGGHLSACASSDGAGNDDRVPARGGRDGNSTTGAGGQDAAEDGDASVRTENEGWGEEEEVPESVRLLVEWVRRSEDDGNFRGRLKAIGDILNADEVGLPSIARRFSGKPILLYGKESSMVRGPGFAEIDVNAHAFSYVGRKGLYVTLDKWKSAIFRIGFLLEGRTDEEQPEHILGCGIFYGLDINALNELSLSRDGKRLIVTKPGDEHETEEAEGHGGAFVEGGAAGSAAKRRGLESSSDPLAHPSVSAGKMPSEHPAGGRNAGSLGSTARGVSSSRSSSSSSSSSPAPLVPRRHMALLRRLHRSGTGGGADGGDAATINPDKAFVCLPREGDDDDNVTLTAVAAAAFAGGWFCALLAVVTLTCWLELSMAAGGGEGESGRWRSGFSAWLLRVFADP